MHLRKVFMNSKFNVAINKENRFRINILEKFQLFLTLLILLWLGTPIISAIPFFRAYLFLMICFLWFFLANVLHKHFLVIVISNSKWFLLWFLVLLIWLVTENNSRLSNMIVNFIYMLFLYIIYLYYLFLDNEKGKKVLVWTILLSFALTALITIFAIKDNPLLSKLISTADSGIQRSGVGSFHFIYAIAIICSCILSYFKEISLSKKILLSFIVCLYIYTVFSAGFVIAILLFIATLFLVLVPINKYYIILIFLFISSTIILNKETISLWIYNFADFFNNDIISGRLKDISYFILGQNLDEFSSVGNRWQGLILSFNTFIKNPFTGVGAFYDLDHISRGVGGHSQWLDDLARYGILGVLPFWLFLFSVYKQSMMFYNTFNLKVNRIFWLYILMLGFINPIFGNQLNITMFILIPFLPSISNNYKKQEV